MATILVVDDDAAVRRAVRKSLETRGHDILEAGSGPDGVRAFKDHAPDIVITDVYMPGGDGMEGVIRIVGEYPDARVIVMTGGGWDQSASLLEKAKSLGAAGTLTKPFDVPDLLRIVDDVLETPDE